MIYLGFTFLTFLKTQNPDILTGVCKLIYFITTVPSILRTMHFFTVRDTLRLKWSLAKYIRETLVIRLEFALSPHVVAKALLASSQIGLSRVTSLLTSYLDKSI